MKILGIDSSGLVASAAVVDGENVLAEFTVNNKQTHSQTLLPMIDNVVKMSEVPLTDIDVIAIASGPGSFTGLRIGSATAKGLGFALGIPVVDVPTLEGLAFRFAGSSELVCPMMDARRCQVYTGLYDVSGGHDIDDASISSDGGCDGGFTGSDGGCDGGFIKEKSDMSAMDISVTDSTVKDIPDTDLTMAVRPVIGQDALPVEEMIEKVNAVGKPVIFMGDGTAVYHNLIEDKTKVKYRFAPVHLAKQSAAAVAALGYLYAAQGRAAGAEKHKPDYLRKPQAEREREKITVSKMEKSDLDAVLEIDGMCFSKKWDCYGKLISNDEMICLTAKKLGKVIGYCVIQVSFETADLCRVGVKTDMRHKGVATLMLEEGKRILASGNVERFLLEVRSSNEAAINLYKKTDFEEIGKRKDYYTMPEEDAVIMECQVK